MVLRAVNIVPHVRCTGYQRGETVTAARTVYHRLYLEVGSQEWVLSGEFHSGEFGCCVAVDFVSFRDGQDCTRNKQIVLVMFSTPYSVKVHSL